MEKKITQEERLDLTDKQVKEETEAYLNSNTQKIIKIFDENTPNGRLYIDKENLIAENQRLKEQLDREIKESRYLLNRLWIISKHLHKESGISNETLIGYIEKLLKEFDYNPPIDKDKKFVVKTFTINLQDGEE